MPSPPFKNRPKPELLYSGVIPFVWDCCKSPNPCHDSSLVSGGSFNRPAADSLLLPVPESSGKLRLIWSQRSSCCVGGWLDAILLGLLDTFGVEWYESGSSTNFLDLNSGSVKVSSDRSNLGVLSSEIFLSFSNRYEIEFTAADFDCWQMARCQSCWFNLS
jgi:hypothetical protein